MVLDEKQPEGNFVPLSSLEAKKEEPEPVAGD
jgi:hypothetical protein